MLEIKYTETDQCGLDSIEPLWLKLREHHKVRSKYFSKHNITFATRKLGLLGKSQKGVLRIYLATDVDEGILVGYCVATVSEGTGEVESIYVEEDYRHSGIADNLMKRAMAWMDKLSVTKRIIGVANGNEEVFGFYSRYNFYPKVTILEQIK